MVFTYADVALTIYSKEMRSSVIFLNELLATLTKWNFCFIFLDMPSKKNASSSHIYSLKVAPCHLPIF